MATASDDPAASICIGCGLCCDGTLLAYLAVSDESDLGLPLRVLGVELIYEADPPVFALPCPAVRDGCCTVFDAHRPHACAQFACRLLRAHDDGTVDRTTALAAIADTLAARAHGDADELARLLDRWFR